MYINLNMCVFKYARMYVCICMFTVRDWHACMYVWYVCAGFNNTSLSEDLGLSQTRVFLVKPPNDWKLPKKNTYLYT